MAFDKITPVRGHCPRSTSSRLCAFNFLLCCNALLLLSTYTPPVLIIIVALRLAVVSYNERVSKPIVNLSHCRHNSPKQVCLTPGKSSWLSFSSSIMLIVAITALQFPAVSFDKDSKYTTYCSCLCCCPASPKHRCCHCVGGIG